MINTVQNGMLTFSKKLQPWSKRARAARYSAKLWSLAAPVSPLIKKALKETKVLKTLRLPIFVRKLKKHASKSFHGKRGNYRAYAGLFKDTKAIAKAMEIPCKALNAYGFFPNVALRVFSFFQTTHFVFSSISMCLAIRGALKTMHLSQKLLKIQALSNETSDPKGKVEHMQGALAKLSELNPKALQGEQSPKPPLEDRIKNLQIRLASLKTQKTAIKETAELVDASVSRAQTMKSLGMIRVAAKATKIAGMLLVGFTTCTTLGTVLVAGSALASFAVWGYSSSM